MRHHQTTKKEQDDTLVQHCPTCHLPGQIDEIQVVRVKQAQGTFQPHGPQCGRPPSCGDHHKSTSVKAKSEVNFAGAAFRENYQPSIFVFIHPCPPHLGLKHFSKRCQISRSILEDWRKGRQDLRSVHNKTTADTLSDRRSCRTRRDLHQIS